MTDPMVEACEAGATMRLGSPGVRVAASTGSAHIPVASLRREILSTARDWGREILSRSQRFANRFYQGYIVLEHCRMLRDLHAGEPGSKRAGADWAKAHLDPRWAGLIDRAWDCRPDPARSVREAADPGDFELTLGFVRYCAKLAEREFGELSRDRF